MLEDDLYLDNLMEYVFDDRLFVTYKFLSMKLGVDVNKTKQMLFDFFEIQKAKGKRIFATYYISGIAPQKWISSINPPKDDEGQLSQDAYYDQDAFIVLLCKDSELKDFKKKFTTIYSLHIYGLSGFQINSHEMLNKYLEQPLKDDDGNAPVHFGMITCKAAFEYRENPRLAPLLKNVQEVKAKVEKAKESHDKISKETKKDVVVVSPVKTNKVESTAASKKPNDTGENKNRLKNMFAAAASKPKPKEVEKPKKVEIVKPDKTTSNKEDASKKKTEVKETKTSSRYKTKETKVKLDKKQSNQTRKRKRIRDVFSSSEDEEEDSESTKKSEDEEEGLPESPIPRKLRETWSDSDDDDFKKETPKKTEPVKAKSFETSSSGKRRVCKTVPKRHVDEDGFLVTVMDQVMVSESDNSDEEKESKSKETEKKTETTEKKPVTNHKEKVPATNDKQKKGRTPPQSSAAAKSKQASIMSFFQKK